MNKLSLFLGFLYLVLSTITIFIIIRETTIEVPTVLIPTVIIGGALVVKFGTMWLMKIKNHQKE